MSDSMFGSLLNMLDKNTVGEVASALGQPQTSVARGMESSIAAMLGGLAGKSDDSGMLRKVLDMVPSTTGGLSWSQIASSVTDPNSSMMATGKRLLGALFGTRENSVTSAISQDSGLPAGATSTLLSMAAPLVIGFISKQVRDGGMTMSGLAGALQRESATLRRALPQGLSDMFWPAAATATTSTVSPVVAQAVQKESSFNWLPILAAAAVGLGLLWFFGHQSRPTIPSVAVGTANRLAIPTPKSTCVMPSNVNLPGDGAAARLLSFVQNSEGKPYSNTWFTMDQITFETGSAALRPESQAQLNNIATVLTNCPGVRVEIAGFTDNVGSADSNLRLSQRRANAVVAQLASKGVPHERMTAEGHGEESPVADNSIEQGRSQNRRAAMRVAQ